MASESPLPELQVGERDQADLEGGANRLPTIAGV